MSEDKKPSKQELIDMLSEMLKSSESMPLHAHMSAITHYDLEALIILLIAIFNAK